MERLHEDMASVVVSIRMPACLKTMLEDYAKVWGYKSVSAVVVTLLETEMRMSACLPFCRTCGRAILHKNTTFPYCSHLCSPLVGSMTGLPWKHGQAVATAEGLGARVNMSEQLPERPAYCGSCGILIQRHSGLAIVVPPSRRLYCPGCVVMPDLDYGKYLNPPEQASGDDLLEYIKKGGVLGD